MSQMSPTSIPSDYFCPISWLVMEEPVLLNCSHRFDRIHIINWLYLQQHCPTCRSPFQSLKRDAAFKKRMIEFFDRHPDCERPSKLAVSIPLIDSFKDLIDYIKIYLYTSEPEENSEEPAFWIINLQIGVEYYWR